MYQRREQLAAALAVSVQIVGRPDTPTLLDLLHYVTQRRIAYTWVDAGGTNGAAECEALSIADADLPTVVLPGAVLRAATPKTLADLLDLIPSLADLGVIDLVIVGSGPAGLAAAVYGGSEGLSTVLIDAKAPGGQAATSSRIENYPGFPRGISGADLTRLCAVQALKFGTRILAPSTVTALTRGGDGLLQLTLDDGSTVDSRAVIIATGAAYKSLPIARWDEFQGRGIYYAATELEARRCGDAPVVVVGGANSAGQAALFLAGRSRQVTLVVRGDDLAAGMSTYLLDRITHHPRITVALHSEVTALHGQDALAGITVTDNNSHILADLACEALFCFIGAVPATDWLAGVRTDADGFICTDAHLADDPGPWWPSEQRQAEPFETSIPNVFAVGDVRAGALRRVAAAIGEGAAAVSSVHAALSR
jgi:thioredoxin reductase (NADPH)